MRIIETSILKFIVRQFLDVKLLPNMLYYQTIEDLIIHPTLQNKQIQIKTVIKKKYFSQTVSTRTPSFERRRSFKNPNYLLLTLSWSIMFTLLLSCGPIIALLLFFICSIMFMEVVCVDAVLSLPVFIMLMLVLCLDPVAVPVFMSCDMMSMGTGNTMVLLFSAEMLFSVCRYLSCR